MCVCVCGYIFKIALHIQHGVQGDQQSRLCVFFGGEGEMARCSVTIIVLNYVLPMTLSYRVYVICVCMLNVIMLENPTV